MPYRRCAEAARMSRARILVIDGNRAATREQQVAAGGSPSGEGYVEALKRLAAVDAATSSAPPMARCTLPPAAGIAQPTMVSPSPARR